MAMSIDVTLPKGVKPTFPNVCIVCHGKPDRTVSFVSPTSGLVSSFFLPILGLFGWGRYHVPACGPCSRTFRFQRWGRFAVIVIMLVVAMPFISELTADIDQGLLRRLAVLGLAGLALLPWIIYEVSRPRYVDTTPHGELVDWEFASAEYAAAFHRHNADVVVASEAEPAPVSADDADSGPRATTG